MVTEKKTEKLGEGNFKYEIPQKTKPLAAQTEKAEDIEKSNPPEGRTIAEATDPSKLSDL